MYGVRSKVLAGPGTLLEYTLHPVGKTDRLGLFQNCGGHLRVQGKAQRIADAPGCYQTACQAPKFIRGNRLPARKESVAPLGRQGNAITSVI